jgi:hypothetical protein
VNPPDQAPEPTPNIQEILRKRRETLNRVKEDLAKVGKLQAEFFESKPKAAPRKQV